jgi:uncharacterized circularly permuted ATP-grasp superfamily protein
VLSRAFTSLYKSMNVERVASFFEAFRDSLRASADRDEPRIGLLTPGSFSETYFEHATLARYLGSCWSRATTWPSAATAFTSAPSRA